MLFFSNALLLQFGLSVLFFQPVKRPQVEVEYDRSYDFDQELTFAWSEQQEPAPKLADHVRITKAVADKLKERGLTPDTMHPDLRVIYRLEVKQKKLHVSSRQRESVWDPTDVETSVALGAHEEAFLVVELWEAGTSRRIWRAKCAHQQPTADRVAPSLFATVEHLFENYPPRKADERP